MNVPGNPHPSAAAHLRRTWGLNDPKSDHVDNHGPAHHSAGKILTGVAQILAAGDPVVWQRLLTDHIADRTGRCAVCHLSGIGRPFWPCTLRTVAEDAQRLATPTQPSCRDRRAGGTT